MHSKEEWAAALLRNKRSCILTGAGVSTASGIPDYRSPENLNKKRNPIQYQEFVSSDATRRRYWGRSMSGWPLIRDAIPAPVHHAIARIVSHPTGLTTQLITQNVDSLHYKAGNHNAIELHGKLRDVICLDCRQLSSREVMQQRLLERNGETWLARREASIDGDADPIRTDYDNLIVPSCHQCGGTLMPHVVFFGGSVDKQLVAASYQAVADADILLAVGTSLTVFSGYRFAKRAKEMGKQVIIINLGPTRADGIADLKLEQDVGVAMTELAHGLLEP